jgi:hypothetical protein
MKFGVALFLAAQLRMYDALPEELLFGVRVRGNCPSFSTILFER